MILNLDNILYLLGNIFRIYLICQFIGIFLDKRNQKQDIIMRSNLVTLFFIINSSGYLYFNWSANGIMISNLIGVFMISLSYNGQWKYRVISTILIVVMFVLYETIIYHIMMEIGITNIAPITVTVSNLLLLLTVKVILKISDLKHGYELITAEWIGILSIPLASIIITIFSFEKCNDQIAIAVAEVGIIALNLLVFYMLNHIGKAYRSQSMMIALSEQNQAYEKQMDILEKSEQNIAALRHDMKNHLFTLQQLTNENDNLVITEYLNKLILLADKDKSYITTGNSVIDGLINLKFNEAESKLHCNLKYSVIISKYLQIDKIDICIILGNILDNALQALEECKDSNVRILEFIMEEKKNILNIHMKNSYEGKRIEVNNRLVSTKKDNRYHGIGLKNVRRIVDKYNGIIETNYDDKFFITNIILYLT